MMKKYNKINSLCFFDPLVFSNRKQLLQRNSSFSPRQNELFHA